MRGKLALKKFAVGVSRFITRRGKLVVQLIKKFAVGVSRFITRRGKLVVQLIALLTVICLAVLLSGYILFDITSNHQPSNTIILNQPSISTADELSKGIFNQGKMVIVNQPINQTTNNSANSSKNTDLNPGVLKNIGIGAYENPSLTSKLTNTDWGFLQPGGEKSVTVYVYNEGNFPVTLSISTSNWTPSTASAYLALTWNYNGRSISPNEYRQLTLTLTVSPDITGISNFNFDIIIVATEQIQ